LPLGDLLGALQSATNLGNTATLGTLLNQQLPASTILGILTGLTSGDALSTLNDLQGALDPSGLTNLLTLGDLIAVPQDLLGTALGSLPATLLTTTTGLLGTVEGLVAQVAGDLTSCLDPNVLASSLMSMLGTLPTGGLPVLDPASLLSLVSADTTVNDILQAVMSTLPEPLPTTIGQLMATPLTIDGLKQALSTLPIPAAALDVLTTVLDALPIDTPTLTLNDLFTLPSEVLPFGLDPMNMSVNDVLSTSVNMLALMEAMAHHLNAASAATLINATVVLPVVTTIDKLGGFDVLGGLMANVPYLTTTLPLADLTGLLVNGATPTDLSSLSSLVSTILGSGDPTGALTSILSTLTGATSGDLLGLLTGGLLGTLTGTLSDLLNSLGGNLLGDLLTTLTGLLGTADATSITNLLGGLTTDPTALLQTLLGLLDAQNLSLPL